MGIKKFINDVKESFGLDSFKLSGKKKSIKILLSNLEDRKDIIENKLAKKPTKALKEELSIIMMQIKKGEKLLAKLEEESSSEKSSKTSDTQSKNKKG